MKLDIVICSNHEVLSNLCDIETEVINAAILAGSRKCFELTGQYPSEDSAFKHWNGGRHDQFRCRCGMVSIREEFRDTSLESIAHEINTEIADALCYQPSEV